MRFLLAHPDHFIQRAVEVTLRDLHHVTLHARDGLDVIDQALDEPPHAIILGTGLAGLNGTDTARALRALAPTRQIPILFITNDTQDTQKVLEAAVPLVDWLQVPLDLTQVREHLLRLVREPSALSGEADTGGEAELTMIADPLTGLYVRKYVLHRLAYEAARATRYGQPLAALAIGIRQADELVKQHGQIALDRVLVNLAALLRRNLRLADLVGRTQSDEFLIIAPHTDEAGARTVAQRLLRSVQAKVFDVNENKLALPLRIGIAISSPTNLTDNLMLFARAEAALERARGDPEGTIELG